MRLFRWRDHTLLVTQPFKADIFAGGFCEDLRVVYRHGRVFDVDEQTPRIAVSWQTMWEDMSYSPLYNFLYTREVRCTCTSDEVGCDTILRTSDGHHPRRPRRAADNNKRPMRLSPVGESRREGSAIRAQRAPCRTPRGRARRCLFVAGPRGLYQAHATSVIAFCLQLPTDHLCCFMSRIGFCSIAG